MYFLSQSIVLKLHFLKLMPSLRSQSILESETVANFNIRCFLRVISIKIFAKVSEVKTTPTNNNILTNTACLKSKKQWQY